ncbi:hypothetical protein [Xylella fastidiosa]
MLWCESAKVRSLVSFVQVHLRSAAIVRMMRQCKALALLAIGRIF